MQEFLTLIQDSLSIHEYVLKFAQVYRYALEMVKDIRSRMSFFSASLGHALKNEVGM